MRAQAIKLAPKPAQVAAKQRMQAVAAERVRNAFAGLLDGLDEETRVETCRTGIRVLALAAAADAGEGRATGVLSGALARVAPAHRPTKTTAAPEALFRGNEGEA